MNTKFIHHLTAIVLSVGRSMIKWKILIVIDYMQKVDTPVGKRYRQISEDILYDTYHGRLPVFFVEDICKDKYVNLG